MGDVAVRAAFGFQSVSTEIHCKTGVWVGKAQKGMPTKVVVISVLQA